jgi:hypothetical protein
MGILTTHRLNNFTSPTPRCSGPSLPGEAIPLRSKILHISKAYDVIFRGLLGIHHSMSDTYKAGPDGDDDNYRT